MGSPLQRAVSLNLTATLLQNALENGAFAVQPASESAGTTDFGTVTRMLPAVTLKVPLVDRDVPGHSPKWALQAGSERGHRCLLLGAKAMAATAYDIFASPDLMARIKGRVRPRPVVMSKGRAHILGK
jgi:aminobenzoyl-glutamate utilization protein B